MNGLNESDLGGTYTAALAAVATAAALAVLAMASEVAAAEDRPVWLEHRPPSTVAIFQLDPERLGPTTDAIARRVRPPNDPNDQDVPSVILSSILTDLEVFESVFTGRHPFGAFEFELLDRSRPLVFIVSAKRSEPSMRRLRHGIPPLAEELERGAMLVRGFLPSDNPKGLATEIEEFCSRLTPRAACPRHLRTTVRDGWLQVDIPTSNDAERAVDLEESDAQLGPAGPALQSLIESDRAAQMYVSAKGIRRFTNFVAAERVVRRADFALDLGDEYTVYRLVELRHQLAASMLVAANGTPASRELQGFALSVDGEGDAVRFDLVQSFTAYGATLFEAGATDVSVPTYDLEQPVFSGAWSFDLSAALEETEVPSEPMRETVREMGQTVSSIQRLPSTTLYVFREGLVRPVTSVASLVRALEQNEKVPKFVEPEQYVRVTGGSVALGLDAEALARGDAAGVLRGGAALVFSDGRAIGPFLNVVDAAQVATGISVRASTARSGEHPVLKLRFNSGGSFSEPEGDGASTPRASFRGDWLRGLLDTVWSGPTPEWVDQGTHLVLQVLGNVVFEAQSGGAGRIWTLRTGEHELDTVDLSVPDSGLPDPAEPPPCYDRAVAASVETYGVDVADVSSASRRRPGSMGGVNQFFELDPDSVGAIEALVEELGKRESECAEVGAPWKERVGDIRDYWRAVLDDEASTVPIPEPE